MKIKNFFLVEKNVSKNLQRGRESLQIYANSLARNGNKRQQSLLRMQCKEKSPDCEVRASRLNRALLAVLATTAFS